MQQLYIAGGAAAVVLLVAVTAVLRRRGSSDARASKRAHEQAQIGRAHV